MLKVNLATIFFRLLFILGVVLGTIFFMVNPIQSQSPTSTPVPIPGATLVYQQNVNCVTTGAGKVKNETSYAVWVTYQKKVDNECVFSTERLYPGEQSSNYWDAEAIWSKCSNSIEPDCDNGIRPFKIAGCFFAVYQCPTLVEVTNLDTVFIKGHSYCDPPADDPNRMCGWVTSNTGWPKGNSGWPLPDGAVIYELQETPWWSCEGDGCYSEREYNAPTLTPFPQPTPVNTPVPGIPTSTPTQVPSPTPDPFWWLLEFSAAVKPPLEVDFNIGVEWTSEFEAVRLCIDGIDCQERATPITELQYIWNTHGWSDGLHVITVQYRRASDNGVWDNALSAETSFFLSSNRGSFAPCDGGDGITLTSGNDCIRLIESYPDLMTVGWDNRSDITACTTGDFTAWLYDGVQDPYGNFGGGAPPKVVVSGQCKLVGSNISSVNLQSSTETIGPVPEVPFETDPNTLVHMHFDNDTIDSAGTISCSIVGSANYVTGQFDSALYAPNPPDGSGVICDPLNIDAFTIELWIARPPGSGGGRIVSLLGGGGNTGASKILVSLDGNRPRVEIWSAGGSQILSSYLDLPDDGSWHYLVVTYDGENTAVMYVDNEQVGSLTTAGVISSGATTLEFGMGEDIYSCECYIDEVRISNEVRSPETANPIPNGTPTSEPTFTPTPDFDCGSVPYTEASIFDEKYCKELNLQLLPGFYNLPDIDFNDLTTAIHVPQGYCVMVYEHINAEGESRIIQWDYWDLSLDTWPNGSPMDNSISSIEVFNNGDCSSTSTPTPEATPTQSFDCGSVPFGGVSTFTDQYCSGTYEQYELPGAFNLSATDDQMTSMHIPSGMSARVYKDTNFSGQNICLSWDYWDFGLDSWLDGSPMNNSISSIEVFDNSNCNPPSTATPTSTPTPLPLPDFVLINSTLPGYEAIYKASPDGTNWIWLAGDGSGAWKHAGYPRVSPNNQYLAYECHNGPRYLCVMDVDGSNKQQVYTNPIRHARITWSSDSSKILFIGEDDNAYTIEPGGGNLTQIPGWPINYKPTSWCTNGKVLAHHSNGNDNDIYSLNPDGSGLTLIIGGSGNDTRASWSNNCSEIVFESKRTGQYEIWKANADGSNQTQLTSTPNGAWSIYPSWSYDDSKIIFSTSRWSSGYWEMATMNADGSNVTNISNTGNNAAEQWNDWSN